MRQFFFSDRLLDLRRCLHQAGPDQLLRQDLQGPVQEPQRMRHPGNSLLDPPEHGLFCCNLFIYLIIIFSSGSGMLYRRMVVAWLGSGMLTRKKPFYGNSSHLKFDPKRLAALRRGQSYQTLHDRYLRL